MGKTSIKDISSLVKVLIVAAVIILLAVCILSLRNKDSFLRRIFSEKQIQTYDTETIITEIKEIGEFTTACYYEELVVTDQKASSNPMRSLITRSGHPDKIAVVAKGTIRAGFDLSELNEGNISVVGDTLVVSLPEARIFDIIINPSDYSVFFESGEWSHNEVKALEVRARNKLMNNATRSGLVEKAEKSGIDKLYALFKSIGYDKVVFNVADPNEGTLPLPYNNG